MVQGRRGGLSGKARRTRDRSRGVRMQADRMIGEYLLEEQTLAPPDRPIPLGSRSEFLPTADVPEYRSFDGSDSAIGPAFGQLELTFQGGADEHKADPRESVPMTGKEALAKMQTPDRPGANQTPSTRPEPQVQDSSEPKRPAVIRPPWRRDTTRPTQARPDRMTLGGFVTGCVVGAAGAALTVFFLEVLL